LNKKHQDYSTDLLSLDILLFSSSYQEDLLWFRTHSTDMFWLD
jgi:hypothetical protein